MPGRGLGGDAESRPGEQGWQGAARLGCQSCLTTPGSQRGARGARGRGWAGPLPQSALAPLRLCSRPHLCEFMKGQRWGQEVVPTLRFSQRHACISEIPRGPALAKGRAWGCRTSEPEQAGRQPREAHTPARDLVFSLPEKVGPQGRLQLPTAPPQPCSLVGHVRIRPEIDQEMTPEQMGCGESAGPMAQPRRLGPLVAWAPALPLAPPREGTVGWQRNLQLIAHHTQVRRWPEPTAGILHLAPRPLVTGHAWRGQGGGLLPTPLCGAGHRRFLCLPRGACATEAGAERVGKG